MSTIKQKAASGFVWMALQKYSTMFVIFVSDIVLARLLSPYDFGCIEMLSVFMLLAETTVNGGFGTALIQKKRPTQEDYSTIFFWNLGMSAVIYTVLFLSAPAISRFYHIDILTQILRIQGLILFVYAFNMIQNSMLRKQLRFKELAIVTVVASVMSLSIAIIMAYKGYGVWALVARNMVLAALTSLIFWIYIKWRPSLVFSLQSFKQLFSFGFFIYLSNLVTSFSAKLQSLLIGRVFNTTVMGYYSKASTTEGQASTSISQILDNITGPLYAEVQDDQIALQNMVKRISVTLAYLTFPLMFVLILVAEPLFVFLYSDRWMPSVPYFQVLCIGGLGTCLQSVNFQTIAAIGKSKVVFRWTMVKRFVGMGLVVGGLSIGGLKGILCGAVLNAWFAYFVNIGLVSKHVGYKWYTQLADLFPVLAASIACTIISYFCVEYLHFTMYLDGVLKLLLFAFLYIGWSLLFKPESFEYSKTIVKPMISKILKKKK